MQQRIQGFSLYEMIAVLIIIGITLTASLPIFYHQLIKQNINTTVRQLQSTIHLAQEEAFRRESNKILVCAANFNVNGILSSDYCSNSDGDWSKGVITFIDLNDDGVYNGNGSNERINALRFDNGVVVRVSNPTGSINKLLLASNGQISDSSHSLEWTITFSHSRFGISYCQSTTLNQYGLFGSVGDC